MIVSKQDLHFCETANADIPLMHYLQKTIPPVAIIMHGQSKDNITNVGYNADDINNIGNWQAFDLVHVLNQHGSLLNNARIPDDDMGTTPPEPVVSERRVMTFAAMHTYIFMGRALRCGFRRLRDHVPNGMTGRTLLSWSDGPAPRTIDNYVPDVAYFDPTADYHTRPNRAPGDIKASWKWDSGLRNSANAADRKELRQALSQVNFYMKQHHARYELINTDQKLVAIKRLDGNGNLLLSPRIPMAERGNINNPRLTPLLALWYLGMLASRDAGPDKWRLR